MAPPTNIRAIAAGNEGSRLNWRDRSAYRPLLQLDRADLDWIFAGRHPAARRVRPLPYRERLVRIDPPLRIITIAPGIRLPPAWGVRFSIQGEPGALPIAFWRAGVDPTVLVVRARRARPGDPAAFDLAQLAEAATVLRTGDGVEHILIADGPRRLRIEVRGDSVVDGPVRLRYAIEDMGGLDARVRTLSRLFVLRRTGRLPIRLFPPDPKVARRVLALQAWDGAAAGASQREIAGVLFGAAIMAGTEGDNRYFDSIRKRVARLIDLAEHRIAVGAKRFFGR